jgi:hypothetical protein
MRDFAGEPACASMYQGGSVGSTQSAGGSQASRARTPIFSVCHSSWPARGSPADSMPAA